MRKEVIRLLFTFTATEKILVLHEKCFRNLVERCKCMYWESSTLVMAFTSKVIHPMKK